MIKFHEAFSRSTSQPLQIDMRSHNPMWPWNRVESVQLFRSFRQIAGSLFSVITWKWALLSVYDLLCSNDHSVCWLRPFLSDVSWDLNYSIAATEFRMTLIFCSESTGYFAEAERFSVQSSKIRSIYSSTRRIPCKFTCSSSRRRFISWCRFDTVEYSSR